MQASAWGRAGPRLQWANLYTRYIPEPLNTCAGRLTVSDSISSKEGVCCGGAFPAHPQVLLPERVREHLSRTSL